MNTKQNKKEFKIKHVLRLIAFVLIVFVFCPAFNVSCYGQSVELSAMDIAFGIQYRVGSYTEQLVEAQPVMLITILLPIAIAVLMFINDKTCSTQTKSIAALACSVIDLIVWFIFKAEVKSTADKYALTYKTLFPYYLNVLLLIVMIAITVLIVTGKIRLNGNVSSYINKDSKAVAQMSSAVNSIISDVSNIKISTDGNASRLQNEGNRIGFCQMCGNPLYEGDKFCVQCGRIVPEEKYEKNDSKELTVPAAIEEEVQEPVALTEEVKEMKTPAMTYAEKTVVNEPEVSEFKFCPYCGSELMDGGLFCTNCGRKVR